jgi:hypothetical protein
MLEAEHLLITLNHFARKKHFLANMVLAQQTHTVSAPALLMVCTSLLPYNTQFKVAALMLHGEH